MAPPAYAAAAAGIVRHAGIASLHLWRRWRTLHAADPREVPHWHLAELGVRPDAQGRGFGRTLLDAFLIRVDERGAPAYLETTRPELVTWYGASGFEVRERVVVTGGAPAWTMWRAARPNA